MFIGLVHAVRQDRIDSALARAYPALWQTALIPVTGTWSKRPPHRPSLTIQTIRDALPAGGACGVLFAFDLRRQQVVELQKLVYQFPMLEVVGLKSGGDPARAVASHLRYFGITGDGVPADLPHALQLFDQTHEDVVVLGRAHKSSEKAADFREPRLALNSMHVLRRVVVEWAQAKAADQSRVKHNLMRSPTRDALRELMQHANFDLSDAADRGKKRRVWICDDGEKRYFGWHLKWSLAGPRGTENHCRIHYSPDPEKGTPDRLFVGHCGEHLD